VLADPRKKYVKERTLRQQQEIAMAGGISTATEKVSRRRSERINSFALGKLHGPNATDQEPMKAPAKKGKGQTPQ
jgi:hypothetical protein